MAYYPVTYSCGHSDRIDLIGKEKDRQRRLAWLESTGLCPECWEKKRAEDKAALEEYKEQTAAEYGLPELIGSEKQIKWAKDIRFDFLKKSERLINETNPAAVILLRTMNAWRDNALRQESAKWWIDNRGTAYRYIDDDYGQILIGDALKEYFKEYLKKNDSEQMLKEFAAMSDEDLVVFVTKALNRETIQRGVTPIKKDEREAAAEREAERIASCTLSPATPETEIRVVIKVEEVKKKDQQGVETPRTCVSLKTPQRNEEVRKKLRELGYDYESGRWQRNYELDFEYLDDRIMEIGSCLFKNGYIVEFPKKEMVQRVIDGDYRLYNPRRILGRDGKFAICWGEVRYYNEAKKIPNAKWDRDISAMLVPAENYLYVKDFAETHKFDISRGAQQLMDEAESLKNSLLIKSEIQEPVVEKPPVLGKIPELQPAPGQIDPSLKDDAAV